MEAVAAFPPEINSASSARRFVDAQLLGWGVPSAVREQVAVLVSELVVNVALHAGTVADLSVRYEPPYVRVEVADGDPRRPVVRPVDTEAPTGRGMRIVDALAHRWGIEVAAEGGKVVWFELVARGPAARPEPVD